MLLRSLALHRRPTRFTFKCFGVMKADPYYGEVADVGTKPKSNMNASHSLNNQSKWQSDYRLSYDNLSDLNAKLYESAEGINRESHLQLLATYYSRFHHLLRDEFQHEKEVIQNRFKYWSNSRLTKEGFTLLQLRVIDKGYLFRDRLYRFYVPNGAEVEESTTAAAESGKSFGNLPFHKFDVGDTLQIRPCLGYRHKPDADSSPILGVVTDKHPRYIDMCIRDNITLEDTLKYRLDDYVNDVAFERMADSLKQLVKPPKHENSERGSNHVSNTLRGLLLFSYPNALLRLSKSSGGLKTASSELNFRSNEVHREDPKKALLFELEAANRNSADSEQSDQLLNFSDVLKKFHEHHSASSGTYTPPHLQPIFEVHEKLNSLVWPAPPQQSSPLGTTTTPYSIAEIQCALESLLEKQAEVSVTKNEAWLNRSQIEAIQLALQQPISLIQGKLKIIPKKKSVLY